MIEKKMVRHVLQNRASSLVIGYLSFSLPIVFNEGGGEYLITAIVKKQFIRYQELYFSFVTKHLLDHIYKQGKKQSLFRVK